MLVAAALRLWKLKLPPTHDEMFTILLVRMPFAERLAMTAGDVHPPLYYEFLSIWGNLAGWLLGRPPGLVTLRLFSVAAGLAAVALLRFALPRRAGLFAAAIWAVHPLAIGYSQTLRSYSLAGFWLAALFAADAWMVGAVSPRERRRRGAVFAAAGLALLYTHLLGAVFLAGFAAVWCVRMARGRRILVEPVAAFVAIALGFAPWAGRLSHQARIYAGHNAQIEAWPTLVDLMSGPLREIPFGRPEVGASGMAALILVFSLAIVIALPHGGRAQSDESGDPHEASDAGSALAVFAIAFLLVWAVSWRRALALYLPAFPLLALAQAVFLGALFASGEGFGALRRAACFVVIAMMLLVGLRRPLYPARTAGLWTAWRVGLPDSMRDASMPRVVYPDSWAGYLPAERGAAPLIPFSRWLADPRGATQRALLIEAMPHYRGYTNEETADSVRFFLAAQRLSGYPPAESPDRHSIDTRTTMLAPIDRKALAAEVARLEAAAPNLGLLKSCLKSVRAEEVRDPASSGFYSLENDESGRMWRWMMGEICSVTIDRPFEAGEHELLFCVDRPSPYQQHEVWTVVGWRVRGPQGRELAAGAKDGSKMDLIQCVAPFALRERQQSLTLELVSPAWQPSQAIPGSQDLRVLGARFYWAGIRKRAL